MKLIDKLAEETYSKLLNDAAMSGDIFCEEVDFKCGFKAGFLKAREMAAKFLEDNYQNFIYPEDHIRELGEDEVKDAF